jgi:serine/threonine protein kinase
VVEWIRQAATALDAAHQMGILHRDIKPSNLWLGQDASGNDQVYLLDFGLALRGCNDIRLTASGIILGTPAYISPEQLDNPDTVAPSGDLFSLGAVFYELLTLKPVFGGANPLAVFSARSAHKIIPPQKLRGEIPKALNDLVMRLLARDPKLRPASAQELIKLLVRKETLTHPLLGRRTLLVGAAAWAWHCA